MKFRLIEEKRTFSIYNDGISDFRVYDDEVPPENAIKGSCRQRTAWNKGLTAKTDERVKLNGQHTKEARLANDSYTAWNKGLTKEDDPRIKGVFGENNPMYGKHPIPWNKGLNSTIDSRCKGHAPGESSWNKGLTLDTDERVKSHVVSDEMKNHLSEIHLDPEFKQQRFNTMEKNGTLGINQDTKAEQEYYNYLLTLYKPEEILHPYMDKDRYPYKCDFYIIPDDLFIEVHGNWTHGKHPFDSTNKADIEKLEDWKKKALTSNYYKNAIYTWTDLDVRKQKIADSGKINLKIVYV